MKAIFCPGPSYIPREKSGDSPIGWLKIFYTYEDALKEMGYEVEIPQVPEYVNKLQGWERVAGWSMESEISLSHIDLFIGSLSYSLFQMLKVHGYETYPKCVTLAFSCADWYRDWMVEPEYKDAGMSYPIDQFLRHWNIQCLEESDLITVPSPFVMNTYKYISQIDKLGIPWALGIEQKLKIVPWGVDSQLFTPAKQEPSEFRALFVGGDFVRKGLRYAYEATKGICELWIVGSNLGLGPNLKSFGLVPFKEMPEMYRQCSVLILPTVEDGVALCVQEAMASGLPVIATPEPAEVFEDGKSGIKVDYKNVEQIRDALLMLKNNPEKRRQMAGEARALAERQTWDWTKKIIKQVIPDGDGPKGNPYVS